MSKTLQIRIPEEQLRALKRIAMHEDTDVSKLVRKLIRSEVARNPQSSLFVEPTNKSRIRA